MIHVYPAAKFVQPDELTVLIALIDYLFDDVSADTLYGPKAVKD